MEQLLFPETSKVSYQTCKLLKREWLSQMHMRWNGTTTFSRVDKASKHHLLSCCSGCHFILSRTWAKESVNILMDVRLGRHDLEIMSIQCLQGGLRAFSVHQKATAIRPRPLKRTQTGLVLIASCNSRHFISNDCPRSGPSAHSECSSNTCLRAA